MDVSLNKPFKAVLRGCWVKYVVTVVEGHCVKSVRIRSYSGPYFPAFGLNTERYEVSLRIQSERGKIRIRITPNTNTFCAVGFPDANTDTSFKFQVPKRQHMIDWVNKGFDHLVQDQEMVRNSVQVYGISSSDPDKVQHCGDRGRRRCCWRLPE